MKIVKYIIAIIFCAVLFSIPAHAYDLTVQVRLSGGIIVQDADVYIFSTAAPDSKNTGTTGNVTFENLATNRDYGIMVYKQGYRIAFPSAPINKNTNTNETRMFTLSTRPSSNFSFIAPFASMRAPSIAELQHFSWRRNNNQADFHTGVDISRNSAGTRFADIIAANPLNRPTVRNTRAGTVNLKVPNNASLGNYVQILSYVGNTAYYVTYSHLDSIAGTLPDEKSTTEVAQSADIGKVGETGDVTGVHLHISFSTSSSTSKTSRDFVDPAACFGFDYRTN